MSTTSESQAAPQADSEKIIVHYSKVTVRPADRPDAPILENGTGTRNDSLFGCGDFKHGHPKVGEEYLITAEPKLTPEKWVCTKNGEKNNSERSLFEAAKK